MRSQEEIDFVYQYRDEKNIVTVMTEYYRIFKKKLTTQIYKKIFGYDENID